MPEIAIRYPEGRFEGEVDDNNIPNGEGELEFPGNDEQERQNYTGEFKDKMAHGKGVMRWRTGDKYEGEFQNGLRHGTGSYFSKVCLFNGKIKLFFKFMLKISLNNLLNFFP